MAERFSIFLSGLLGQWTDYQHNQGNRHHYYHLINLHHIERVRFYIGQRSRPIVAASVKDLTRQQPQE